MCVSVHACACAHVCVWTIYTYTLSSKSAFLAFYAEHCARMYINLLYFMLRTIKLNINFYEYIQIRHDKDFEQ